MIHNTHFKGFWPQLQSSFIVEQLSAVNLFLCKNSWWLLLLVTFVTVWWLRMMTEHQTFRKKPIWFAQYNSLFCLILKLNRIQFYWNSFEKREPIQASGYVHSLWYANKFLFWVNVKILFWSEFQFTCSLNDNKIFWIRGS